MRLFPGEKSINVKLPSINGSDFNLESIEGRPYMLSFLRFATCPFCNLRINQLVKRYSEFGDGFTIVAVFDAPIDHLTKHASGHEAPFHILADQKNTYYRKYGIEKSILGVLKGMTFRFPTLLKGLMRGYFPNLFVGSMLTMPADFLIDSNGIVQIAYYGKDEGDHLPFDQVKRFSLKPIIRSGFLKGKKNG